MRHGRGLYGTDKPDQIRAAPALHYRKAAFTSKCQGENLFCSRCGAAGDTWRTAAATYAPAKLRMKSELLPVLLPPLSEAPAAHGRSVRQLSVRTRDQPPTNQQAG
ncbi:hypothetical protein Bbelb_019940 [Branchiostoma belcheri]|nr:hypothetical protein Bbelb_019940 [Branchiostoma belcheri]